jgi:predicted DNA-binding protein
MLKTYLYIPDHLEEKIKSTAKSQKKSKAEVIRQTLEAGFESVEKQKVGGAEALLRLAELAKKLDIKGPRDLSVNHDYYLWGGKKKNPRIKP